MVDVGFGSEAFCIERQCRLALGPSPQAHRRMNVLDERVEI